MRMYYKWEELLKWINFNARIRKLNMYNPDESYKFVSWNVNGMKSWIAENGKAQLQLFIENEAPTCLMLQETKLSGGEGDAYKHLFSGYKGYFSSSAVNGSSGTAVFLKTDGPEIVRITFGKGGKDQEGRTIVVEYSDMYLVNSKLSASPFTKKATFRTLVRNSNVWITE